MCLHAAERGDITQCPQCRVYEDGVNFPIDNTLFNTIQLLFPNEYYERRKILMVCKTRDVFAL